MAYSPEKILEGQIEVYRRNFKAAVRVEKADEGRTINADLIVVHDFFAEVGQSLRLDAGAILLTLDNQQVDKILIKTERPLPFIKSPGVFGQAVEGAAEETRQKLEVALRSLTKLAELNQARAVAASSPQATQAPRIAPTSDVDKLPVVKAVLRKHAYAVVIGIEQYREKLPTADFADRDATLMGEYLTKVLGYPEENVIVRINDKAARTDLEKYFEGWLPNNVEKDSSVFVYYSGHGAPNPKSGDAYLVPYDGDPTFVEKTAYPLKRLYAALDKLPAKDVTVVLDSCFSGAGGRSVLAEGARPMGLSLETALVAGGKTVVLAASSGDQISSTFKDKGHGLLTYYFLKGLQGEGDMDKDGAIEMAELYDYVKPNVQRIARKQYNNEQTPQLLASPDVLKKGGGRLVERVNR
ncbi:MAG: hypothetical protein A3A88_09095 [Nitrospirae bacterium RIFCSPLOWO2_01_FULL_62_17]|nr:MAG: hypothetical protein A3A88_09095 [Nitrospirae bacterium RIFCSPLOWO2_01_FULL_62_17]OGX08415.1 MAG: hypothetical protein A3K11_12815 [Nitrospirae bacterium RIFCSPLOWO2_12_FULL_63_8]